MKKLWEKNKIKLDPIIEAFETESDLVLDQKLIKYDIVGSIAHAQILKKIGILSEEEFSQLEKGLSEILSLIEKGKFKLEMGDEDMHTRIENYLIEKYGETGQKIHTARSRNDQVLTAIRLYSKEQLISIQYELRVLIESFNNFSKQYGSIKMPGYTHMQKAMPSSIKLWVGSFIESLQDDLIVLENVMRINDQSPLGSAAGYGTSIKLDREYTTKLLGFAKVQYNYLYCQNSRGKIEAVILASLIQILLTINKFASDIMLFTTSEFNFFKVANAITTGSSIMPQKKNLDLAELLRSKIHVILGNYTQIVSLSSNLISGYNRDLQDVKKPIIESLTVTLNSIKVTKVLLNNLYPNKKVLESALTDEIFAAEKAFKLVKEGIPFRQAYKEVASKLINKKRR